MGLWSVASISLLTNLAYFIFQAREKAYDLEANLALLKLYQFNPTYSNLEVVMQILLKSLTNLPHTDFVLCKCLLSQEVLEDPQVNLTLNSFYCTGHWSINKFQLVFR